jgi:hypothetical protein
MSWRRNPSYVKVKAFPPQNFFFALISLHCIERIGCFLLTHPPLPSLKKVTGMGRWGMWRLVSAPTQPVFIYGNSSDSARKEIS